MDNKELIISENLQDIEVPPLCACGCGNPVTKSKGVC